VVEQAVDLAGNERLGSVGFLGEQLVALPAAGECSEQPLVVAEAEPQSAGGDAVAVGARGDCAEAVGVATGARWRGRR
jgi:hypothetical protein